jgi:hypothetical protein
MLVKKLELLIFFDNLSKLIYFIKYLFIKLIFITDK